MGANLSFAISAYLIQGGSHETGCNTPILTTLFRCCHQLGEFFWRGFVSCRIFPVSSVDLNARGFVGVRCLHLACTRPLYFILHPGPIPGGCQQYHVVPVLQVEETSNYVSCSSGA